MGALHRVLATLLGAVYVAAFLTGIGCGGGGTPPPPEHEAPGAQLFESPQADAILVSPDGTRLYMALTTMGKVRVINTGVLGATAVIDVGIDPVSLALRPDGSELWVAKHVSDSYYYQHYSVIRPIDNIRETIKDLKDVLWSIEQAERTGYYRRAFNVITCRRFCSYANLCAIEYVTGRPNEEMRRTDFVQETPEIRGEGYDG